MDIERCVKITVALRKVVCLVTFAQKGLVTPSQAKEVAQLSTTSPPMGSDALGIRQRSHMKCLLECRTNARIISRLLLHRRLFNRSGVPGKEYCKMLNER